MISTHIVSHRKDPKYHTVTVDWVITHGEQFPDKDMLMEIAEEAASVATFTSKSGMSTPVGIVIVHSTADVNFHSINDDKLVMTLTVDAYSPLPIDLIDEESLDVLTAPVDMVSHAVTIQDHSVWGFIEAVRASSCGYPLLLPADVQEGEELTDTEVFMAYKEAVMRKALVIPETMSLASH